MAPTREWVRSRDTDIAQNAPTHPYGFTRAAHWLFVPGGGGPVDLSVRAGLIGCVVTYRLSAKHPALYLPRLPI